MSLSTGIVAGASVNCDNVVEIVSLLAASKMYGKNFTDIKLSRKDKMVTLAANNKTVKIRRQNTEVNPTLLFNRLTCVVNSSSDMEGYLAFELIHQSNVPENSLFVLDGGHLLQTVVWPTPSTYASVYKAYLDYILKHYGAGSTVVFDGDGNIPSTKVVEQRRRSNRYTSRDILFEDHTPTSTLQGAFLANSNNKNGLIKAFARKDVKMWHTY